MAELRADFPAESENEAAPGAEAPARPAREPRRTVEESTPPVVAAVPAAPAAEPLVAQPVAVEPARHAPEPEVVAIPLPREPQVIASFAPPPATYNVVSEHDKVEQEASRPVRRRRQASEASAPAEPLQLVETKPGAAPGEGASPQS